MLTNACFPSFFSIILIKSRRLIGFPLPLVILAAAGISKAKGSIIICIVYILWVSNIFTPITYLAIIIPTNEISHVDITQPTAEFGKIYKDCPNQTLVVGVTPQAAWHCKNPDYWLYFSYSGRKENLTGAKNGFNRFENGDTYTGAKLIIDNSTKVDKPYFVVLDTWSRSRIDPSIVKNIISNCSIIQSEDLISKYYCAE